MDYTVIGSTVNVASRIEGLTKRFQTDILISKATFTRVEKMIDVREHPPAPIRDVAEHVRTYAINRFAS